MEQEPKYLLIVKVARGLVVRDTPRPESQGAKAMRSVGVGTALYAFQIINVGGVDYARLVPQNPQKPEWVRVAEADDSIVYVDVIKLDTNESTTALADVIKLDTNESTTALADAIILLAAAIRELAMKS